MKKVLSQVIALASHFVLSDLEIRSRSPKVKHELQIRVIHMK